MDRQTDTLPHAKELRRYVPRATTCTYFHLEKQNAFFAWGRAWHASFV